MKISFLHCLHQRNRLRQFINCVTACKGLESAGLHFPADSDEPDRLGCCLSASDGTRSCPAPRTPTPSSHPTPLRYWRREIEKPRALAEPSCLGLRPPIHSQELLGPSCHPPCQPGPNFQAFLGLWLGPAHGCQSGGFLENSWRCGLGLKESSGVEVLRVRSPGAVGPGEELHGCLLALPPAPRWQPPIMRPGRHLTATASPGPGALHY